MRRARIIEPLRWLLLASRLYPPAAPDAAAQTPNPSIFINSPSVTEGDSGTTNLTFTGTLSAASGK